jgi:hypothetical protein
MSSPFFFYHTAARRGLPQAGGEEGGKVQVVGGILGLVGFGSGEEVRGVQ